MKILSDKTYYDLLANTKKLETREKIYSEMRVYSSAVINQLSQNVSMQLVKAIKIATNCPDEIRIDRPVGGWIPNKDIFFEVERDEINNQDIIRFLHWNKKENEKC